MGNSRSVRLLIGAALVAGSTLSVPVAMAGANAAAPGCGDIRPYVHNIVNSNIRCPEARKIAAVWLAAATRGSGPARTYVRVNGFRCHYSRYNGGVRCWDGATGGRAGIRTVTFRYSG